MRGHGTLPQRIVRTGVPAAACAVLAYGCGGSAESPTHVVHRFINAIATEDGRDLCAITTPEAQRVILGGSGGCEHRARRYFSGHPNVWWQAIAHAKVGNARISGERSTVPITGLPLRGGGTTQTVLNLTYVNGHWLVGPL